MSTESPPAWLQNGSYAAEQTRRAAFAAFASSGGIIGSPSVSGTGSGVMALSAPVSGMSVNIATGQAMVPGTIYQYQGLYYMLVNAQDNEAVAASNPSNPRVDLVCATIDDAAYAGVANDDKLQVVTGTPTAGATLSNLNGAPSLPANSLLLGYVLVPAGASNIITADLLQKGLGANLQLPTPPSIQSAALSSSAINSGNNSTTATLITIPQAGAWDVTVGALISPPNASTGPVTVALLQNGAAPSTPGSAAEYACTGTSVVGSLNFGCPLQCNAGDLLTLKYTNNCGGTVTFASGGAANVVNGISAVWLHA